jgi:hypothetical protein
MVSQILALNEEGMPVLASRMNRARCLNRLTRKKKRNKSSDTQPRSCVLSLLRLHPSPAAFSRRP